MCQLPLFLIYCIKNTTLRSSLNRLAVLPLRYMSTLRALIVSIRPQQQIKNVLVFAPLVFSGLAFSPGAIGNAVITFVAFCLASGAVYLFNDICDRAHDRAHPIKKHRPVASGDLDLRMAYASTGFTTVGAIGCALVVSPTIALIAITYLLLTAAYSLALKNLIIIDIFTIASGFVLRVVAGMFAINVPFSPLMAGALFFIATCIASGKREAEQRLNTSNNNGVTRTVLSSYDPAFLRTITDGTAVVALVIYIVYVALEIDTPILFLTAIIASFCIYRFIWIIRFDPAVLDDPTELFFKDVALRIGALLYLALTLIALY